MTEPETLPEHIGPYRVTGHLGRGGMGEVLRGHDDRLDRPVALKRIRPGGKDPEKARQRFRREARVVARLSHQTIVQVYDWVEAGGHDWLVMELVDGHSLDDLLAAGPLPPERAVAIARQVASGLAAAHEAGLVHRDLKPANVMVTTGGDHPDRVHPDRVHPDRIKILDFGIAKQVGLDTAGTATEAQPTTLTEAGQVIGTVAYMSPEQALGYPVDHRSDLFSLGTLLYEMLSGVSPFAGDSAVETLSRICSTRETPLRRLDPNVTEDVAGLVGRLLEKEPERRPASAREVAAELDRLAAGSDAARPAATGHDEAGPYDATLEMPASVSEKVARVVEASDTYSIRKVSGRWVLAAAAVPLIVAGLWGLSSWLGPKAEEEPVIDAPAPTARMSDEGGQVFETDYEKGRVLLGRFDQKGNLAQAIEMFGALADRYPDSAAAHASLAQALWRKHWVSLDNRWLEQALPVAKRAVELDPYLASGQVSLGLVSMEIGELDAATEAFESALRLNPASALVHSGLGQLHEARGELENAELAYQRALEIRPQAWDLHIQLGTLYFQQSRLDEAAEAFERSMEGAPANTYGVAGLSGVYFMQGHYDEAAAELQKAIAIRPHAMLYTNLGNIFFYQGLYEQAIAPFRHAVELEEGAKDPLMWGNLGDALRWTPGYEGEARTAYLQGVALLREKLAERPGDTEVTSRLALHLARSGGCTEAQTTAAKTESSAEIDASTWFRLVLAHEQCGERQQALTTLGKALAAGYSLVAVEREQELDRLRTDPGFLRLRAAHND